MLCENCGENEANVKYTQIVNGVKKEMTLCSKCAKEMGIGVENFNMPINLSSFFGEFINDVETDFLQEINDNKTKLCKKCNMSYDEFINTGKFGCANCYDTFSGQIDTLLKNLQGASRHIGRKLINSTNKSEEPKVNNKEQKENKEEDNKLEQLNKELKIAIKEERYEDAAKIRDEIKKLNS